MLYIPGSIERFLINTDYANDVLRVELNYLRQQRRIREEYNLALGAAWAKHNPL